MQYLSTRGGGWVVIPYARWCISHARLSLLCRWPLWDSPCIIESCWGRISRLDHGWQYKWLHILSFSRIPFTHHWWALPLPPYLPHLLPDALLAIPPKGGVDIGPHGRTGAIIMLWWHFQRLKYCLPACLVLLIVNIIVIIISGALGVPPRGTAFPSSIKSYSHESSPTMPLPHVLPWLVAPPSPWPC